MMRSKEGRNLCTVRIGVGELLWRVPSCYVSHAFFGGFSRFGFPEPFPPPAVYPCGTAVSRNLLNSGVDLFPPIENGRGEKAFHDIPAALLCAFF